jgi:hypothetical protein
VEEAFTRRLEGAQANAPENGTEVPHDTIRDLPDGLAFRRNPRRLSTYESFEGGMDLESEVIGGSAREPSHMQRPLSSSV